jgi:hypothetical protein
MSDMLQLVVVFVYRLPAMLRSTIKVRDKLKHIGQLDCGVVAGTTRAALVGVYTIIVGPEDFLGFTTPDVIGGIDVVFSARCQAIEFEELFGSQLTAEW